MVSELTELKCTCLGDTEPDTSVEVLPPSGNDTPVHIIITGAERSHSYSEDSRHLIICNEASLIRSLFGCFNHDGTQLIDQSPAPVLGIIPELWVVLTRDCHGSSICSCYHCWSRQLNWLHCMLCQPEERENWSCKKIQRKKISHGISLSFFPSYSAITQLQYIKKKRCYYHKRGQEKSLRSSWWEGREC